VNEKRLWSTGIFVNGVHQFVVHLRILGANCIRGAVLKVIAQHGLAHAAQSCLDARELLKNIDARALIPQHLRHALHLAFNAVQPYLHGMLHLIVIEG